MKFVILVLLFVFGFLGLSFLFSNAFSGETKVADRELLLDAICQVESGGNARAVGDGGESRGAYQIQEACWKDSRYPETYLPNVWDKTKSRKVVVLYCTRYAGASATDEAWARTHNGGPKGPQKKSTLKYWEKVKAKMAELQKK